MTDITSQKKRVHRHRIMPVLLMKQDGLLYKTERFKNEKYVGDPRIAVKIFNDKGADEIILLDITATVDGRKPNFALIEEIASEAFMPMAYGGGIKTFDDARALFSLGIEKIVVNSAAYDDPSLIKKISDAYGVQSVVVSIDTRKGMFGRRNVFARGGGKKISLDPVDHAKQMELLGAGEIFINEIDRDGTFRGYDVELCKAVADAVSIPVIACGGAGVIMDCVNVVAETGVSAAAAGSIFVFQGPHRAVLIKFPTDDDLKKMFLKNTAPQ